MINQTQYLVIKNCRSNKALNSYLEKICNEEHVHIVEEYFDSFSFLSKRPSIYSKYNANFSSDALLCSSNYNKLLYIKYLYEKRVELYNSIQKAVSTQNGSDTIAEFSINISQQDIDSAISWEDWIKFKTGSRQQQAEVLDDVVVRFSKHLKAVPVTKEESELGNTQDSDLDAYFNEDIRNGNFKLLDNKVHKKKIFKPTLGHVEILIGFALIVYLCLVAILYK